MFVRLTGNRQLPCRIGIPVARNGLQTEDVFHETETYRRHRYRIRNACPGARQPELHR
jgi:hypothetical protein